MQTYNSYLIEERINRMKDTCRMIIDILEDEVHEGKMSEYEYIKEVHIQLNFYNSLKNDTFFRETHQKQIDRYYELATNH